MGGPPYVRVSLHASGALRQGTSAVPTGGGAGAAPCGPDWLCRGCGSGLCGDWGAVLTPWASSELPLPPAPAPDTAGAAKGAFAQHTGMEVGRPGPPSPHSATSPGLTPGLGCHQGPVGGEP